MPPLQPAPKSKRPEFDQSQYDRLMAIHGHWLAAKARDESLEMKTFAQREPAAWDLFERAIRSWREELPSEIRLEGADLRNVYLPGIALDNAKLAGAKLDNAILWGASLNGADLVRASAAGADFRFARMEGANFDHAVLSEANFESAMASRATFRSANLSEAKMLGAQLVDSVLDGANVRQADLKEVVLRGASARHVRGARVRLRHSEIERADFSGSELTEADFESARANGANFSNVTLEGSRFRSAILEGADFSVSRMRGAVFYGANLRRSTLSGADLTEVDLRRAQNYQFDSNLARGLRIDARANDRWSVLRRTYTGARFVVVLALLTLYLLPILARGFAWTVTGRTQATLATSLSAMLAAGDSIPTSPTDTTPGTSSAATLNAAVRAMRDSLVERLPRDGSPHWRPYFLWQLLLKVDQGWLFAGVTILLLVYNACRGVLTFVLSEVRDEEDRSGYTPASTRNWRERSERRQGTSFEPRASPTKREQLRDWWESWFESYAWLWRLHLVVTGLFWVAVLTIFVDAVQLLATVVYVPQ